MWQKQKIPSSDGDADPGPRLEEGRFRPEGTNTPSPPYIKRANSGTRRVSIPASLFLPSRSLGLEVIALLYQYDVFNRSGQWTRLGPHTRPVVLGYVLS